MTPKEKAEELVQKFNNIWSDVPFRNSSVFYDSYRCALTAVDEIINDCDASSPFETMRLEYWGEVKKQIQSFSQPFLTTKP